MERGTILVTGGAGPHRQPHGAPAARARRARGGAGQPVHGIPAKRAGHTPHRGERRRPPEGAGDPPQLRGGYRDAFCGAHHRAGIGSRPPEVLRQQHLLHAQPAAVLPRGRDQALRVFLDRSRVRHPGRRLRGRARPDRADQPVRHLEADVRMDAAGSVRGLQAALCRLTVLQRRRLGLGRPHRAIHPGGHPAGESGLPGCGGQAPAGLGIRKRLPHAGWHRGAGLHPRGRPGHRAPECARLPACGRCVRHPELRIWGMVTASARCSPASSASPVTR